ncbi:MAG: VacJ family lipoprotein [Pseudobdellovibrionaceae bacterium]
MTSFAKFSTLALLLVAGFGLNACSSTEAAKAGASTDTAEISDPFEETNRGILKFNEAVDKGAIEPVARGYRYIVPTPARKGIHNFLTNLRSPTDFANQVLQGDVEGAGNQLSRTIINTLIGVGGLFDVAGSENLPHEQEDFGQTLAVWGVGHGPYLMVPVLGPSSARDLSGDLIDSYVDPVRLWLFNTDNEEWYYAKVLVGVVDTREGLLDVIDDLRTNSIDYYATLRSVYAQNRAALVNDQDPALTGGADFSEY